jgi:hypothetical protein
MTGDMSNFGDFEAIPAVVEKSAGRFGDNELSFAFPEVLEVIQLCSVNQIAVLGVELFKVREDGLYQTEKLTDYDLRMKQDPAIKQEWPEYVRDNNARTEELVRQNPAGEDHVYVLTASSWRELGKIEEIKKVR